MSRFCLSSFSAIAFTIVVSSLCMHRAAAQEIGLTPMQATEVARGYRAGALELKTVVNENRETIGSINDFIFGKDGNNYVVLAVGDFTGLNGELVAIPFNSLKLDDPSGNIILPGASRTALSKLPVFISKR